MCNFVIVEERESGRDGEGELQSSMRALPESDKSYMYNPAV